MNIKKLLFQFLPALIFTLFTILFSINLKWYWVLIIIIFGWYLGLIIYYIKKGFIVSSLKYKFIGEEVQHFDLVLSFQNEDFWLEGHFQNPNLLKEHYVKGLFEKKITVKDITYLTSSDWNLPLFRSVTLDHNGTPIEFNFYPYKHL